MMFRRTKRTKRAFGARGKTLRVESLEARCLLTGDVTVVYTAATRDLAITGDIDANVIEITAGEHHGQYVITGKEGTDIIGPSSIKDPVDRMTIDLAGGSDSCTFKSDDPTNKLRVTSEVEILNKDGNNLNKFVNVQINNNLTVRKTAGESESNLEIVGTTIIGAVVVNNNDGGHGASKTKITAYTVGSTDYESHLQSTLTITNGDGQDILNIYRSLIDDNVNVTNGNGDTRTVLGQTEQDPVILGNLVITNGTGNDETILHDTDVWGFATIDNGVGHAYTTLENTDIGLGAPVGITGDLTINSRSGYDEVSLTNSTVRDDLIINNDLGDVAADEFGSLVHILASSRIGNDLRVTGDNGWDHFKLQASRVVDDVYLNLKNGGSSIEFLGVDETRAVVGEHLNITTGAGVDDVRLEKATVEGDTTINLGLGADWLRILKGSKLLGSSSLTSGDGIDRFQQQILPPPETIEIAFIAYDDFNVHEYITS